MLSVSVWKSFICNQYCYFVYYLKSKQVIAVHSTELLQLTSVLNTKQHSSVLTHVQRTSVPCYQLVATTTFLFFKYELFFQLTNEVLVLINPVNFQYSTSAKSILCAILKARHWHSLQSITLNCSTNK